MNNDSKTVRNSKYQFSTDEQNIFFTSDTHFGHNNILKYCERPWNNVYDMNQGLIENWNSVVGPDDIVFHLGDFVFGGSEMFNEVMQRLNGKKYLILGNHDYKNIRKQYRELFVDVKPKMIMSIDGQEIILNHEPLLCFGGQNDCRFWQLFGHVHTQHSDRQGFDFERLKQMCTPTMYDVGVDFNNYTPINFKTLKERIAYQIENKTNYLCFL